MNFSFFETIHDAECEIEIDAEGPDPSVGLFGWGIDILSVKRLDDGIDIYETLTHEEKVKLSQKADTLAEERSWPDPDDDR